MASNPCVESLTTYRRPVLAAFGLSAIGTVGNYTFNIFMPTIATRTTEHRRRARPTTSAAIAAVVLTILTPVMGGLSDKIGRKPLLLASAVGYVVLSYPLFLLLAGSHDGPG